MKAYAAYNRDINIREKSSSGGVFYLLAMEILKQGGVVYGAAFDESWNVKHIRIDNEKDLNSLLGSKYVYSDWNILSNVKTDLDAGLQVLFSGTPCQIAGLYAYLKNKQYDNLYLVDTVCHGAPDKRTWVAYLHELSRGRIVKKVSFRDKLNGWEHYNIRISFDDGTEYCVDHDEDPYMRGFIDNYTLRDACYHCKNRGLENRKSDLTLGDLWGVNDIVPAMNDDMGISLIIINSNRGGGLLNRIIKDVNIKEIRIDSATKHNPSILYSAQAPVFKKFYNRYFAKSGEYITSLEQVENPSINLRIYRKVVSILNKLHKRRKE